MRDRFGRTINYMRISVTDRCNLRCRYCMPERITKCAMQEILTYEEIVEIAQAAEDCGITRFKITGGEPLVRMGVETLVRALKDLPLTEQVTMTTNGVLLEEKLPALMEAGLDAVNISLDTTDREKYRQITGRDCLQQVLSAIRASAEAGIRTKINAVLIPGCNEDSFLPLVQMGSELPVDVRFIELMPIGEGRSGREMDNRALIDRLNTLYPGTTPDPEPRGNGPAVYYAVPGFAGRIGFISAIHGKFCDSCNRVRLTSTGFLKQCLCFEDGADLRAIVRSGEETGRRSLLTEAIRSAASNKPEAHSFDRPELITEKNRMSGIGG